MTRASLIHSLYFNYFSIVSVQIQDMTLTVRPKLPPDTGLDACRAGAVPPTLATALRHLAHGLPPWPAELSHCS